VFWFSNGLSICHLSILGCSDFEQSSLASVGFYGLENGLHSYAHCNLKMLYFWTSKYMVSFFKKLEKKIGSLLMGHKIHHVPVNLTLLYCFDPLR
jgi:hypothetical protein